MTRVCPRCDSEIAAEQNLCPVCFFGEGLRGDVVECPRCHTVLDADARFCSQCGATVSRSSETVDPIQTALAEKLGNQYRIGRLLGRGGMGSVYLARDLTLDREVAIKVINTSGESRELYDRFRREARTAARLSHPNIVPLHAFGDVKGMPYFVMGYVRGESLADRLRREGKLREEDARRIFAEIADALDHAHQQGVVHRDVKPDNVLLEDRSGRALLTDFGVAKAVGQGETLTQHGSVVGTPDYMSPEQASGAGIDARSDIYSLGVMAWAMVTGRLPFEGNTPADVLRKHLVEDPPALRSVAPNVNDATAQAIERCLAKDPDGRWPDARSLKLALEAETQSQLPDALRSAESSGILALVIAWSVALFYAAFMRGQALEARALGIPGPYWDVYITNLGVPAFAVFAYLFFLMRLRREGFSFQESQRAIWREPAWWLWWYPPRLRRRENVWVRLPASVRALRWTIELFVVNTFLGWTLFSYFGDDYLGRPGEYSVVAFVQGGVVAINAVAWGVFTILARRELRRKGLFEEDVNRVMMSVPPSRAGFWARPRIAAILAPAEHHRGPLRSGSPHDHLQSILRMADELSGSLRPLGAEAAVAARQLVASIDQIDREIADLERNLEPGEEERLADKIEALSTSSTSADTVAPMRSLLEKQLELIQSLSAQIDESRERRGRRVEMLRTLALHVASLRSRQAPGPSELLEVSDKVKALCDDIHKQAAVLEAVSPPSDDDDLATTVRAE